MIPRSASSTIFKSAPQGTAATCPAVSVWNSSKQHLSRVGSGRAPASVRGHNSMRGGSSP
jgi:hypothetical protein